MLLWRKIVTKGSAEAPSGVLQRVVQCVAVCCSVLQCVAVRCSALQCVAVYVAVCAAVFAAKRGCAAAPSGMMQ